MRLVVLAVTAALGMAVSAQAADLSCVGKGSATDTALKAAKLTATNKTAAAAHMKKGAQLCKEQKNDAANKEYDAVTTLINKK